MHRNRSVNVHQLSMVPRTDVPRSSFRVQKALKTTFDAGFLVPIYFREVLPGDTFNLQMTAFVRLATPLFPVMDNLHLETFFFFIPWRLTWTNWVRMMGEQINPADSISFTVPQVVSAVGGFPVLSIYDYFGLPTVGQVGGGNTISCSCLPLRAYNLIWDKWFRDENLQNSLNPSLGDGPQAQGDFVLQRRGKRKDYFTGALPWPQKGGVAVSLPLGTTAPVRTQATDVVTGAASGLRMLTAAGGTPPATTLMGIGTAPTVHLGQALTGQGLALYPSNLYADLSTATAATINSLRQAFQIQRFLERDARGGTRYVELLESHFGVRSPDARLQRPEYLGGGSTPIHINPVAQTSASDTQPTPQGNLAAFGTALARRHGFSQSFVEHGCIIGLVNVRADLTYQQGLLREWSRLTRYDFYWPVFAMLGEQAILNKEIFADGSANDALVFGYQERWAEYRYNPSQITGLFRSTSAGTIDPWHLAQDFGSLPGLNSTFIQDSPPLSRILAVGAAANGQQLIGDFFFDSKEARPMPLYSVPGAVDHL